MRTESMNVRWEKVSDATDLSYAKEQLGELKTYDYKAFGVRGIYELNTMNYMMKLLIIKKILILQLRQWAKLKA